MKRDPFVPQAIALLLMLVVQYAFGMATNLFTQFPEGVTGTPLWAVAWSSVPLASHIIIGFLLLFGSLALMIRALRRKDSLWATISVVGFLAILVAGGSGASFVPSQNDILSYAMSLAFLVAFIAYGWGLYAARPQNA